MKKGKKEHVFWISVIITAIIIIFGLLDIERFGNISNRMMEVIDLKFSGLYLWSVFLFVIFGLALAVSPLGKIRLGPDDCKPEYSTTAWFAMLFCAGMGVGLVFWGISEPLSHYVSPIETITGGTTEAADFSIRTCFMHWGIHPWAIYSIVGLGLAYAAFRKNRPVLMSSVFVPLIGEKAIRGPVGKAIDIFAVIVSVAGVSTSLGMACLQLCSGMNYLYGLPNTKTVWVVTILVITALYMASALRGLEKGVKVLSNINLYVAIGLILLCLVIGPTGEIFSRLATGVGDYIQNFVHDSLHISKDGNNGWLYAWRIFYWAWWIAWAPFVGIFIARISKGRTVREFIIGVVLVPAIASIIWFSVFGGMSLHVSPQYTLEELKAITAAPETALFIVLNHYPIGKILSVIALFLLFIFFVTSADSATIVLAELTTDGSLDPPPGRKLVWGVLLAGVSIILILAGGLKPLQNASVAASLPFVFIMLLSCVAIVIDLVRDRRAGR